MTLEEGAKLLRHARLLVERAKASLEGMPVATAEVDAVITVLGELGGDYRSTDEFFVVTSHEETR